MLPAERQTAIFHHVEARGSARTMALAKEFGVTDETIRKDLACLERDGRVLRVHGGAGRNTNHRHELPLPERQAINRAEKMLVARAACALVEPRDTCFLDASSTVLMVAECLPQMPVTVLTNAHHVIVALGGRQECDLICTGGVYEERSRSYVGTVAEEALRRYVIRWMFVGVDGLHPSLGAGEVNPGQAILKKRVIPRAENLCVVCDHTKFGRKSPFLFARADQIDCIVTDTHAPADMLRRFEDAGVRIVLADSAG